MLTIIELTVISEWVFDAYYSFRLLLLAADYPIKDVDGDGSISPEELIQILTSLGESPGDLNLYFAGMATDTTTDYRPVVSWLTFLLKHSKFINKNPTKMKWVINENYSVGNRVTSGDSTRATIEADLCSEFEKFGGNTTIESDALYDWIEETYPDLDEGKARHKNIKFKT